MATYKHHYLYFFSFVLALSMTACTQKESPPSKKLIRLFDGQSLARWHMDVPDRDSDTTLREPFMVRNHLLVSLGTPNGHLITDTVYSNYTLGFDYRFVGDPGNCGVLVHASTPRALYKMFPKSIEVQLMHQQAGDFWCIQEDIQVPDMEVRRGPKAKWGISEGLERRIMNLTDSTENPLGSWNHMTISCLADTVTVWLNGVMVNKGWGVTARSGRIAIQAEGAEVEFKNLIMEVPLDGNK